MNTFSIRLFPHRLRAGGKRYFYSSGQRGSGPTEVGAPSKRGRARKSREDRPRLGGLLAELHQDGPGNGSGQEQQAAPAEHSSTGTAAQPSTRFPQREGAVIE